MPHLRTATTRPLRRLPAVAAVAVVVAAAAGCISSASVSSGVLTILGTQYGDAITLRLRAGDPNTLEVDDSSDPAVEYAFDRSTFTSIVVDGLEGDDTLTVDQSNGAFTNDEATTLLGGAGNDTLVGGSYVEALDGGPGADTLQGKVANDVVLGGDDADRMLWDPGDGSDTVDGGAGTDTYEFHGSNASETFDVANVGGAARLTRNVALITIDLKAIEALDLTALGGTDVVRVGNLTGTGLASVDTDLAGFGGTDDVATDEVQVPAPAVIGRDSAAAVVIGIGTTLRVANGAGTDRLLATGTAGVDQVELDGTPHTDSVAVIANGTEVLVDGLVPGLHVATSAVEQLDVELGAGDDDLTATGNLVALTTLAIDGGDGRDTILGGNGADVIDGGADADAIDGNQGNDTIRGGDGSDVVTWDPGDGSDLVVGGPGSDRLQVNASNASERFELSKNGSQARLTRDVALIQLDLDTLETVDLDLIGGADVLTVSSLTGTPVTSVDVDLAAFGGGPDGAADQVTLNGTAGVDTVAVAGVGSAVEVTGLVPFVRLTGAEVVNDRLTVNGLGGTDVLSATAAATALIPVDLIQ